jgi:hypothetical protein
MRIHTHEPAALHRRALTQILRLLPIEPLL